MHSIFLGVVKSFFCYWFDHVNTKPYSLKSRIKEKDERLLNITPPSLGFSALRSITKSKKWRAHDFLNFILHYSLIVFTEIMNEEYYENLKLFVCALENLF